MTVLNIVFLQPCGSCTSLTIITGVYITAAGFKQWAPDLSNVINT